jgi:hypothetical protein
VLDYGLHKEICSYRLEDGDIFTALKYTHRKKGIFVVTCHLHNMDEQKKTRLTHLITAAQRLGAEYIHPSAMYESAA